MPYVTNSRVVARRTRLPCSEHEVHSLRRGSLQTALSTINADSGEGLLSLVSQDCGHLGEKRTPFIQIVIESNNPGAGLAAEAPIRRILRQEDHRPADFHDTLGNQDGNSTGKLLALY